MAQEAAIASGASQNFDALIAFWSQSSDTATASQSDVHNWITPQHGGSSWHSRNRVEVPATRTFYGATRTLRYKTRGFSAVNMARKAEAKAGAPVSDETVKRLEERISSAEEKATLRLAEAMARLDAKFSSMETHAIERAGKTDARIGEIAQSVLHINGSLAEFKAEFREANRSSRSIILGSVIAILAIVIGAFLAMTQVLMSDRANIIAAFTGGMSAISGGPATPTPMPRATADPNIAAPPSATNAPPGTSAPNALPSSRQ